MHVYFVAFVSGWAAFGAFITIIPWEAIYVVDILGILFPQLKAGKPLYSLAGADIYIGHIVVGTIISIILYLINRRGVATSATLQRILCFALVGAGILAGFETIPQGIESAGGNTKSVGKTVVYGGDRVFAVGLSKSIQKFIDYQDVGAKYTISTLKDFMGFGETERQSPLVCVEVKVTGKEPYCGKELKDTGIQSEEHCMIVGIKREDDTIMMPHATTVIRQGDVLWVMGAEMNVEHLEALSKE